LMYSEALKDMLEMLEKLYEKESADKKRNNK